MRWAKLNAHPVTTGRLNNWSRITRNGWDGIGGACYVCRCQSRSCWPRSMLWNERWFLGFENFVINALQNVDYQGHGQREDFRLPKWRWLKGHYWAQSQPWTLLSRPVRSLSYNTGECQSVRIQLLFLESGWILVVMFFFYKFYLYKIFSMDHQYHPYTWNAHSKSCSSSLMFHTETSSWSSVNSTSNALPLGQISSALSLLPRQTSECVASLSWSFFRLSMTVRH